MLRSVDAVHDVSINPGRRREVDENPRGLWASIKINGRSCALPAQADRPVPR